MIGKWKLEYTRTARMQIREKKTVKEGEGGGREKKEGGKRYRPKEALRSAERVKGVAIEGRRFRVDWFKAI